ncbi:MAG TPA: GntR family transcriptional regulator [Fibrobacteria bacterium]|nr:GntR family transcriptional regulator [Fibrobacteria bacterium]
MIEIDSRSPLPVYEQIVLQIRKAISEELLAVGDPLPPIRQLALDLEVNPATVAKAYQLLEKDRIIHTAGRRGTFVHARAKSNLEETLHKKASEQIRELITYWKGRGLSEPELLEIFHRNLKSHHEKT